MENLDYMQYMASVRTRLRQHIIVRGSEGLRSPEADDILLFQTNFSTKLSHKFGKFRLGYVHGEHGARLHQQKERVWGTFQLFT